MKGAGEFFDIELRELFFVFFRDKCVDFALARELLSEMQDFFLD